VHRHGGQSEKQLFLNQRMQIADIAYHTGVVPHRQIVNRILVPQQTQATMRRQFQLAVGEATLAFEHHCHQYINVDNVPMLLVFPARESSARRLFSARNDSV
jgi:hypothetical protein